MVSVTNRLPLVWHLMGGPLELTYTPVFLSWDPEEEYWNPNVSDMLSTCRELHALRKEIFKKLCAGILFKFQ